MAKKLYICIFVLLALTSMVLAGGGGSDEGSEDELKLDSKNFNLDNKGTNMFFMLTGENFEGGGSGKKVLGNRGTISGGVSGGGVEGGEETVDAVPRLAGGGLTGGGTEGGDEAIDTIYKLAGGMEMEEVASTVFYL